MKKIIQYRKILQDEFEKRTKKNCNYSLRAFARDLAVSPSLISRVLSGQRNLSLSKARQIARTLFKDLKKRRIFIYSVEYETSKICSEKKEYLQKLERIYPDNESRNLKLDVLKIISNWYHVAIMDMTDLYDFNLKYNTTLKIAKYLGVDQKEVKESIERLISVGLLKRENKKILKRHHKLVSPSGVSNQSIKEFHKQMLQKATTAITRQSIKRRYITGQTITISQEAYQDICEQVCKFQESVGQIIHSDVNQKNKLYHLGVQFFDLKNG